MSYLLHLVMVLCLKSAHVQYITGKFSEIAKTSVLTIGSANMVYILFGFRVSGMPDATLNMAIIWDIRHKFFNTIFLR